MKTFLISAAVLFVVSVELAVGSANSQITAEDINAALAFGRQAVADMEALESTMIKNNNGRSRLGTFSPEALNQSKMAAVKLHARQFLSKKFNVPPASIDLDGGNASATRAQNAPSCSASYPFRSYDGTCNNLKSPQFGKSMTIFGRLFPANYADGVSEPRKAVSGKPLPSPRLISTSVSINDNVQGCASTLLMMQWGQFLDHDLTIAPTHKTSLGETVTCCKDSNGHTGAMFPSLRHTECLPITIPSGDPLFSAQCMEFTRSTFGLRLDGTSPTNREHINALTHWIDGSNVYGSTTQEALSIRDTASNRGLMKTSVFNGRQLLPVIAGCCPGDPTNSCVNASSCFVAGDGRVREHPLLTIMHTIWVREHNRVANELFKLYGASQSDEFYFQQARKIVISEMQHIIYNEYLPALIGNKLADQLLLSNVTPAIQRTTNPAIYTEFSTAAYRMGHSQIKSFIRLYEADGSRSNQSYFLGDSFFQASRLLNRDFLDNALRGLTRTPVQSIDQCFADDITSQLFRNEFGSTSRLGLDLLSLNLQRGRDHGLPTYAAVWSEAQRFLFNSSIGLTRFDDLRETTSEEIISSMKKVYESVGDIDLYIGGVTERPLPGAEVGPTFAYIIYKQFENLRNADRFFYDASNPSVSWTKNQLNEIKKASLSRVICDNNDGTILSIQGKAFFNAGMDNPVVACSLIPGVNIAKLRI